MTYNNCKKLIELAEKKGTITIAYASDMQEKLDIFLLNNRITQEEYTELISMLNTTSTK